MVVVKHVCQRSILTTPLRISWLRRWIAREHGLGDPRTLPVLSETCTWTDTFAGPIEISEFSLEPPLKKVNEGLDLTDVQSLSFVCMKLHVRRLT